ncbi:bacteriocin immunity protein [Lactiplantibacillus daowaiensis]|uniref:Bacteriocin immunity protein n=1 Tax=Lactiplantibacillus daowaiensis TaxID=2559918 RepID=A0ABW1RY01_9LACO|nr:bacteriocin immunity protein [Lactiplantibacillus daowaiensis]
MLVRMIGLICIAVSIWQLYAVRQAFLDVKHHGNAATSTFIAYGLWTGLTFAIIFLIGGFMLMIAGLSWLG